MQALCERYRTSQIKAAVKVNQEMLHYYWLLGKDITERDDENKYGSAFYATLSRDLKKLLPKVTGLSESSIRYAKRFYMLYNKVFGNLQQAAEDFQIPIFNIPWGHQVI